MLAVCLITNPMNQDTMLLGAEYRIIEKIYETPAQRSFLAENDLPAFCITADYCLWERDADGEFVFTGQMEPYILDKEELARYTAYEEGWRRKYRIGDITDSYILHLPGGESEGWMYIAFRTSRGDTLLGFGREDISERNDPYSDDSGFMWLYRLESTFGKDTTTGNFLDRSLAATVGGDVDIFHTWSHAYKPGYIIAAFESDDSEYNDGVTIPSPEKTDMGFAVFYHNKDESGYRLLQCHVYEDAALAENGIYLCPDPAVLDLGGKMKADMTYDVILLNNDKIEKATRIWEYTDGKTETQSDFSEYGHQMLLYSWENDKAGCRVKQYFYDEFGEQIAETGRLFPVSMTPTTANITGAFDGYLYVPIDGATYRYERIFDDPASVTCGKLMYQFTEEAEPNDVEWRIYAVDDYPDRSVVLAEAGDDYVQLYRYSPSKAVDPAMLEAAKDKGKIVIEDGYVSAGADRWDQFYRSTLEGESYFVEVAHYLTLGNGNYDAKYYEAYKEDYPYMTEFDLAYDGTKYILHWREQGVPYVREYKYLRMFEDTLPSAQSSGAPQKVIKYVLTNNNTASWEKMVNSLASSRLEDYIDYFPIYSEKN